MAGRNDLGDLMAYDDMAARIYADSRFPAATRALALAFAWVLTRDPSRPHDPKHLSKRVREILRPIKYKETLAEDAPRYEQPRNCWETGHPCEAPRLRPYQPRHRPEPAGQSLFGETKVYVPDGYTPPPMPGDTGKCDAPGRRVVIERDPVTGWYTPHWFCRRHTDHADRVAAQVATQNKAAPPPIPTVGGLLPCYFTADWTRLYTWALPRWEPPYYGIVADEWPTPGTEPPPRRPRLRLITGFDNELAGQGGQP